MHMQTLKRNLTLNPHSLDPIYWSESHFVVFFATEVIFFFPSKSVLHKGICVKIYDVPWDTLPLKYEVTSHSSPPSPPHPHPWHINTGDWSQCHCFQFWLVKRCIELCKWNMIIGVKTRVTSVTLVLWIVDDRCCCNTCCLSIKTSV